MGHRQARTYPLLGLLFANLLTNVVLAKLAAFSAPDLSDDSDPWLAYNRPQYAGHYQNAYQPPASMYWNPLPQVAGYEPPAQAVSYGPPPQSVTYGPPPQPLTYGPPPLATPITFTTAQTEPPIGQQQIININGFIPNDYYQDSEVNIQQLNPNFDTKSLPNSQYQHKNYLEPIASESNQNVQRENPKKSLTKRATYTPKYPYQRGAQNRPVTVRYKKYKGAQQKRKRFTTTPAYYDSYEEYTTTKYTPRRKNRPNYRRTTTETYDEYEESYEATTKPYRRQRPVKNKNKRRPVYEDDYNYENSYEDDDARESFTETVSVRQRQATSTTTDATTITTSPTTPSSTTPSMNVTTASTTNTTANSTLYGSSNGNENISITYTRPGPDYLYPTFTGYGPSNGNENISITYGPPTRLEYAAPYFDWYTPQTRTNEVVRRVHDIVGFDRDIFNHRLT